MKPDALTLTRSVNSDIVKSITVMKYVPIDTSPQLVRQLSTQDLLFLIDKIGLLPVKSAIMHEKTKKRKVEERIGDLKKEFWSMPLVDVAIVCGGEMILTINGNHKQTAAIKSEFQLIPVLCHDYETIGLGTWYPLLPYSALDDLLRSLKPEKISFESGYAALQTSEAYFMAAANGGKDCYLFRCGRQGVSGLISLQSSLLDNVEPIGFTADTDYKNDLNNGNVVLFRRAYEKNEVVEQAKKGMPFPQKSTRFDFTSTDKNTIYRAKPEISNEFLSESPHKEASRVLKGILKDFGGLLLEQCRAENEFDKYYVGRTKNSVY